MHITTLQPQNQHLQVYNLYLDGQLAGTVSGTLVQRLGLAVGQELSATDYEQLQVQTEEDQLLNRALRFLAPRPRSREEVRRRLLAPGTRKRLPRPTPEMVECVLDHLEGLELLDDRQFADFWVENREQFSPRSARALAQELRQRGVPSEAIEQVSQPDRDEERALAAGRRRLHTLATLNYQEFQVRLGQFLHRRGFDYDIVRAVLPLLWEESRNS